MAGRVTIATVAHHARVSRQTVSNVINAPQLVRPETRERVRAAIEALGYRVSQAARQMRTGRSRLIAVRIGPAGDGINGSVLDRFLHGLTEAAAPAGYRIVLYAATGDDAEIAAYEELLGTHDLDGFVLTGTHPGDARTDWLTRRGVPFVTFGRTWEAQPEPPFGGGEHSPTPHRKAQPEPPPGVGEHSPTPHQKAQPEPPFGQAEHSPTPHQKAQPEPPPGQAEHSPTPHRKAQPEPPPGGGEHPWVDVDGAWGTRAATERLLAAGHRRIGFIGWPPGSAVGEDRRQGWAAALRAAGAAPSGVDLSALERRVDDRVVEGERAAVDLLGTAGPSALVCASDSLALGALRAATAHRAARSGITEPRIAVIGFDDTPVAQAVGLTSVSQPLAEAAAGCIALLIRLLDGADGRGDNDDDRDNDNDRDNDRGRGRTREGAGEGDCEGEGEGGFARGGRGGNRHILLRPRLVVRDSG